MKLGVIVLAHQFPDIVATLLASLRHPRVRLYLHVDSGADLDPFRRALGRHALPDVCFLPRFRSRWGGVEVVDAELAGLRQGVADGCDYVVLLSGQDCALQPVGSILEFLEAAPARSYVHAFPLPDPRWAYEGRLRTDFYTYTVLGRRETCIPTGVPNSLNWRGRLLNSLLRARSARRPARSFPTYVRPYGGSQWWNLSRAAAAYVLTFTAKYPEYRLYHEHTLLPDEVFFQSILWGTPFRENHEIVDDALRFIAWPAGSSHPRLLDLSDLPNMLGGGMLFARKLGPQNADTMLEALSSAGRSTR